MVHFNLIIEMYAKGLTHQKLAQMLNVNEETLHQKIYGEAEFSTTEMKVIADLFPYCTSHYLFNGYTDE